jgi:hypothetical protein
MIDDAVNAIQVLQGLAVSYLEAKRDLEVLIHGRRAAGKMVPSMTTIPEEELEWDEKVLDEELVPA